MKGFLKLPQPERAKERKEGTMHVMVFLAIENAATFSIVLVGASLALKRERGITGPSTFES